MKMHEAKLLEYYQWNDIPNLDNVKEEFAEVNELLFTNVYGFRNKSNIHYE